MKHLVLATGIALSLGALPAVAATSFADDFSAYGSASAVPASNATFLGNWVMPSGNVDYLVAGSSFGDLCTLNTHCVDLDGTGGSSPRVFQTGFTFDPGTYHVTFDLTGSHRGTTETGTVTLGSQVFSYDLGTSDVLHGSFDVTLATASALMFMNDGNDNIGALLNSVAVRPSTVPLPAAGLALLAGLGALGALRRRKA